MTLPSTEPKDYIVKPEVWIQEMYAPVDFRPGFQERQYEKQAVKGLNMKYAVYTMANNRTPAWAWAYMTLDNVVTNDINMTPVANVITLQRRGMYLIELYLQATANIPNNFTVYVWFGWVGLYIMTWDANTKIIHCCYPVILNNLDVWTVFTTGPWTVTIDKTYSRLSVTQLFSLSN